VAEPPSLIARPRHAWVPGTNADYDSETLPANGIPGASEASCIIGHGLKRDLGVDGNLYDLAADDLHEPVDVDGHVQSAMITGRGTSAFHVASSIDNECNRITS